MFIRLHDLKYLYIKFFVNIYYRVAQQYATLHRFALLDQNLSLGGKCVIIAMTVLIVKKNILTPVSVVDLH